MLAISCQVEEIDSYSWGDHLGTSVQLGLNIISVDVADTSEHRTIGLSNHDSLGLDQGMLFVYPDSSTRTFWMKGMQFPIDIIWIAEDCSITNITENVPIPDQESVKAQGYNTYSSKKPVRFVLEVNAGYVEDYKVFVGDKVIFLDELAERYKC